MQEAVAIAGILGALLLGAISPGPSFVLVARISIAVSRREGLTAALGMGVGGVIFGGMALFGLHAVLAHVEGLYLGLKLLGGLYLMYLALRLWRSATDPIIVQSKMELPAGGSGRSFFLALAAQIGNPKTAVVYGSIFEALLPADPPLWLLAALVPLIFLVETCWYAFVAFAFSSARPRAVYLKSKCWIDRTAGSVMGVLGLRLILAAVRPG